MQSIGRYQLVEKLGQGGMGVVYRAFDTLLQRVVAVKVIGASVEGNPDLRERFFREARAAGQLSHRNIITIHDLGEHEGQPYLAMEYLEGQDLQRRIAAPDRMGLAHKMDVAIEICEGLTYAHGHGVVHRDIKPANIYITGSGTVKILDFGLARLVTSELTHSNMMMGTLNYMSPEQVRGERADQRSDIFSTGVVLYELFGGRKAFEGDSFAATLYKILQEVPAPLLEIDRSLPPPLVSIVERALAKPRDERYQQMNDMLRDLMLFRQQLLFHESPASGRPVLSGLRASDAPQRSSPGIPLDEMPTMSQETPIPVSSAHALPAPARESGSRPRQTSEPAPPLASERRRRPWLALVAVVALVTAAAAWAWMARSGPSRADLDTTGQSAAAPANPSPAPPSTPSSPSPSSGAPSGGGTVAAPPETAQPPRLEPAPPAPGPDRGRGRGTTPERERAARRDRPLPPPPGRSTGAAPESATTGRGQEPAAPAGRGARSGDPMIPAAPTPAAPPVEQAPPVAPPPVPDKPVTPPSTLPGSSQSVAIPPAPKPVPPQPEPAPTAPRPPAAGIRELLGRYEAALESRDLAALRRLWPTLGGREEAAIRREFEHASQIEVQIGEPRITVAGATATVEFPRIYQLVTTDGQRLRTQTRTTMQLRRAGDDWTVEQIRFDPVR